MCPLNRLLSLAGVLHIAKRGSVVVVVFLCCLGSGGDEVSRSHNRSFEHVCAVFVDCSYGLPNLFLLCWIGLVDDDSPCGGSC